VIVTFAQGGGPVIPDFGRGDECIRENGNFICLARAPSSSGR